MQALQAEGLNGLEIAERLGMAGSTVYDYLHDPTGEKAKARKWASGGKCNKSAPFASWAEAIEAAGFPRPARGKYERSELTRMRMSVAIRAAKAKTKAAA
jgi:transcriptional regulator with XRE-family HTH domain